MMVMTLGEALSSLFVREHGALVYERVSGNPDRVYEVGTRLPCGEGKRLIGYCLGDAFVFLGGRRLELSSGDSFFKRRVEPAVSVGPQGHCELTVREE